ncbi:hypothetical protein JKY79_03565 [Candidatus Babeliales bacterium]|nr:hypothetical protein [Candidatus Babeliales bacterium]
MILIITSLMIALSAQSLVADQTTFICASKKDQVKRTVCAIQVAKGVSVETDSVAQVLSKDLLLTDYFETSIKEDENPFSVRTCKQLFDEGADFLIHVSQKKQKTWLRSLFFSELPDVEVVFARAHDGKVIFKTDIPANPVDRTDGVHKCADKISEQALGLKSCFQSTLAWCEGGELLIGDPLGIISKPVVTGEKLVFAPTWHQTKPLLFYSKAAQARHVLRSINVVNGKKQLCVKGKGLNMQLIYNAEGDKSLMVMSGGKGNSELFISEKDIDSGEMVTHALTKNRGTNSSPLFLPNGDIIFCSDFETRSPQLYYLYNKTKKTVRLTGAGGYCASPSYCPESDSLVYTKPKNGIFQLYTLSLKGFDGKNYPRETQLTSDRGNKTDPVWHPNGLLVAFVYEFINTVGKQERQIALLNHRSKAIHVVTRGSGRKGFPAWIDKAWWHAQA